MRKVFITGVGSLVLSGLLVTHGWAGAYKADLVCPIHIPPPPVILLVKKGKVTITAKGDVKGSIKLFEPLTGPLSLNCEILCEGILDAGPVECVEADTGDTTLHIKAPGLGAALSGLCFQPAVAIGPCISTYIPPGP